MLLSFYRDFYFLREKYTEYNERKVIYMNEKPIIDLGTKEGKNEFLKIKIKKLRNLLDNGEITEMEYTSSITHWLFALGYINPFKSIRKIHKKS